MTVNDTEPRYQLVDSGGNVVGTFYFENGSVRLQEGTNQNEATLSNDGTFNVPSLSTASTHYVPPSKDLQTVIDGASTGDCIIIEGEHSFTSGITVDKELQLHSVYTPDATATAGANQANLSFSSLGASEDALTISGDNVSMSGDWGVEVTDGSGRHGVVFDAGSTIRRMTVNNLWSMDAANECIHLEGDVHLRFNQIWGFRAGDEGFRCGDGVNTGVRLFGQSMYFVGSDGNSGNVATVFLNEIKEGDIGAIIAGGGGPSFGGRAYRGVLYGGVVEAFKVGMIKAETTSDAGVLLDTTVGGDQPTTNFIGTIDTFDCASSTGFPVNIVQFTDSFIGTIGEFGGNVAFSDSVDVTDGTGTVIGTTNTTQGVNLGGSGEEVPLILENQGKHIPGATAGDLEKRSTAFDTTNNRWVWKDADGNAFYVAGTAL